MGFHEIFFDFYNNATYQLVALFMSLKFVQNKKQLLYSLYSWHNRRHGFRQKMDVGHILTLKDSFQSIELKLY